ncbi:hypothetical protein D037_0238B, partial [Vibrio parahaemolyticus IDH02640]
TTHQSLQLLYQIEA